VTYYGVSLLLEILFQLAESLMRSFVILLAMLVLICPPIVLWRFPDQYTPMVETLLNALLFGLALWLGNHEAAKRAEKHANAKWLPQAASACSRLLTVWASVRNFQGQLGNTCTQAIKDLPELEHDKMRAVKTMLNAHCGNGAARMGDIVNHLEDALEDWLRFIGANCEGDECAAINAQIEARRTTLKKQLGTLSLCDTAEPAVPAPVSQNHHAVYRETTR
jgi:hypothetical protein